MKLSLALLPLIGLAIRQSSAFPALRGSNDQDGHAPSLQVRDSWVMVDSIDPWFHKRDTDSSVSNFWLGPDILGGEGASGVLRHVGRDVQRHGQNPESYGLGPMPSSGHWPRHRDQSSDRDEHHDKKNCDKDRQHKHEHQHEHDHEHKHDHEHDHDRHHDHEHNHDHDRHHDHGGLPHHSGGACVQRDFTPRTRHFDWTITYGQDAPDGFRKKRILINGQSPGPLIEVNEGDTVVVKVKNFLDQGTSIHWHGMFQNSTPFMDGIAGFSQCPIPPGSHLTYRFKIEGQYGSYWWHSHSKMQYTDGLYGGLIVHSKRDPYQKCRDYDDERHFLFADNYHDFADYIVSQLLSTQGYNGSSAAPSPQSGLINGRGQFDCAALARAKTPQPGMPTTCTQLPTPTMNIEPNKRYRFRFINTGSHAQHIISIDNHEMYVIGADGTPVKPHKVHRIPIHNGQRHDVLVDTNVGKNGDSFLLRSTMMTTCFAFVDPLLDPVANLTLQYKQPGSNVRPRPPIPHDWKFTMGSQCQDLSDADLIPAIDTSVPANHNNQSLGIFNSQFGNLQLANGTTLGRFFIDNITQTNYVNKPYLEVTHAGQRINSSTIASLLVPDDLWIADIIINNVDNFLDHPFHLHGTDMHIVARGQGNMTQAQWLALNQNGQPQGVNATALNLKNPLRRDTVTVTRSSYIVARIIADLPGTWPLHCHISMHIAEGLMAVVAIHPKKIQELKFSQEVLDLCPSSGAALNEIEPA